MTAHPLASILEAAANGSFPPADGAVELLPPAATGWSAIVALTGHAYVLADVDRDALEAAGADGFGGASHPDVQRLLAGRAVTSAPSMRCPPGGPRPGPYCPAAATSTSTPAFAGPRPPLRADRVRDPDPAAGQLTTVVARAPDLPPLPPRRRRAVLRAVQLVS